MYKYAIKRIIDIVISFFAIVILIIPMLVIAIIIKIYCIFKHFVI